MEIKNNGTPSPTGTPGAGTGPAASIQQDIDSTYGAVRTRIAPPSSGLPRPGSRELDADEIERMARRYSRDAQLALEGLLYWSLRWPFELMATLVAAGRKWEEEYNRPAPRRRVSLYDGREVTPKE
jgi:hypothetical protein